MERFGVEMFNPSDKQRARVNHAFKKNAKYDSEDADKQ